MQCFEKKIADTDSCPVHLSGPLQNSERAGNQIESPFSPWTSLQYNKFAVCLLRMEQDKLSEPFLREVVSEYRNPKLE